MTCPSFVSKKLREKVKIYEQKKNVSSKYWNANPPGCSHSKLCKYGTLKSWSYVNERSAAEPAARAPQSQTDTHAARAHFRSQPSLQRARSALLPGLAPCALNKWQPLDLYKKNCFVSRWLYSTRACFGDLYIVKWLAGTMIVILAFIGVRFALHVSRQSARALADECYTRK